MRRPVRLVPSLGRVAVFVLLGCAAAVAQQGRGSISGTITDPNGSAVPDATVTITNLATQATFTSRTTESGTYTAPSLVVGEYLVSVEKQGFKNAVASNITLQVDQAARVDLQLEVGALSERVEVTGVAPLVDTGSATVGKVIENRRVTELPLNGRNALALMTLAPSVKSNSGPTQSGFSDRGVALSAVSINGGPGGINQYILDGATNNQSYLADINVNPAVDAVEEFKVQTSTMSSEFGFTAGGVVNIVTKSGTNQFHGSLYDFVRDDRFDARNAFAATKGLFSYNQGGGAIGGPIYDTRAVQRQQPVVLLLQRRGLELRPRAADHADGADRSGATRRLLEPAGRLGQPHHHLRSGDNPPEPERRRLRARSVPEQRHPGSERLDPVAQNILPFYPLPNRPPDNPFTNANNWRDNIDETRSMRQWTTKLDHRLSTANTLSFRYNFYRHNADGGFSQSPWPDPIVRKRYDTLTTHNFVVSDTHTFTPGLLHEVRLSNARQGFPFVVASFGGDWPQQLGLPASVPPIRFRPSSTDSRRSTPALPACANRAPGSSSTCGRC